MLALGRSLVFSKESPISLLGCFDPLGHMASKFFPDCDVPGGCSPTTLIEQLLDTGRPCRVGDSSLIGTVPEPLTDATSTSSQFGHDDSVGERPSLRTFISRG